MLIWFGLPLALIAAAAFLSHRMIRRHTESPGRVALGFLGAEIGAAALASAVAWVQLGRGAEAQCESGWQSLDALILITGWIPALLAGVAISAIVADARKQGGALVWHLPAVPVAVALALYVLGQALIALMCIQ